MKGLELALLALGGLAGTFLRYKITESPILFGALQTNVLIVNIVGSFILGLLFVMTQQWNLDTKYVLFAAVGFCGSLTTMSSFALETTNLLDNKQFSIAALNILANVGLSIGAIFSGRTLMSMITAVV
ncbi:MAG: fluoride efflux transporter CrcB [Candidatus Nitrosotenuis sp.]